MESYRHRLGRFSIARATIGREGLKLLPLFAKVVVIDCDYEYSRDAMIYEALSPEFEEIPAGQAAPAYEWMCTTTNRGEVSYSARRIACL